MIIFKDISKASKCMQISGLEIVKKFKWEKFFWGNIVKNLRRVQSACQNLLNMTVQGIWWVLMRSGSAELSSYVKLLVWYSNVYPISHSTVLKKLYETPWQSLRMHTFPNLCRGCLTRLISPSVLEIPQPHRKLKQSLKPLPGNLICELWWCTVLFCS